MNFYTSKTGWVLHMTKINQGPDWQQTSELHSSSSPCHPHFLFFLIPLLYPSLRLRRMLYLFFPNIAVQTQSFLVFLPPPTCPFHHLRSDFYHVQVEAVS